MPVKVLKRKSTETVSQLLDEVVSETPGAFFFDLKRLAPDNLHPKAFIQGKIHTLWDVQRVRSSTHRKLVINDPADVSTTINVFLYGDYADGINTAKKGDTLVVNSFEVEESANHNTSKHKHQVFVHEDTKPNLWLITEETSNKDAGSSGKNSKMRKYQYTNLQDVKSGTVVDVYGVVKFLKPPKQTRGTDLMLIVSLIDPTLHEHDQKLTCVLFLKSHKVPKIEVGNVVRFHRLKIITHQGSKQGGTTPGFSWLVYSNPDSDPQTSTPNFTLTHEDRTKVKELFDWSKSQEVPVSDSTCCLNDIAVNVYFNLVCQVVSTCMIEDGVCFLMRVWDGTRPVYPVRDLDTNREECIVQTDLDLQRRAVGYLYDVCAFDDHVPTASRVRPGMFIKLYNLHAAAFKNSETSEDLSALPTVELVLHRGTTYGRGMLFLKNQSNEVKELKKRLDSIKHVPGPLDEPRPSTSTNGAKQTSTLERRKDSCSSVEIYSEESDDEVTKKREKDSKETGGHKRTLQSASKSKSDHDPETEGEGHVTVVARAVEMETLSSEEPRCMQETATVIIDHPHVKRTKIRDVLDHPVPYKFRVKARVWDYHPVPTTGAQFAHVYCSKCNFLCNYEDYEHHHIERLSSSGSYVCPTCKDEQPLELMYMIQLLLHDGSAGLAAKLWRKEADKFFKDIAAADTVTDPLAFSEVKDILNTLCSPSVDIEQKPWIECCLCSYKVGSEVNYQVFDTVVA